MPVRRLDAFWGVLFVFGASAALHAATPYSDHVIQNTDPVIYWNQDETGGSTAFDAVPGVGGANDGSYVLATLGGLGPRPSDGFLRMGPYNKAPFVAGNSGATSYTSLSTTAGIPTGSYTYQMWFNATVPFDTRTLEYLFTRGNDNSSPGRRDAVYVYGNWDGVSPKPTGQLAYINGGGAWVFGERVLSPNTWNHLLFVRDDSAANKARVYLNGKLEMEDTSGWAGGAGDYLTAATRTDFHGTLGLYGRYDEVALWDRPLSDAEAKNVYLDALGTPYVQAVMRDDPEAYWRLNETTGTDTAADATGNGHDFPYYDPVYSSTPSRTGAPPDVGPRRSEFGGFDADNNAPTLPGDEHQPGNDDGFVGVPSGVLSSQNDYSVEMWFRRNALSQYGAYLMHRNDLGHTNGGDYLGVAQDGRVFVYDGDNPGVRGTTYTAEGEWYHVAMVREGNDVRMYLNGLEEVSTPLPPWNEDWDGGTWTFGGRNDTGRNLGQEFDGNIDEVAIYGRAMSGDDFQENYLTAMIRRDSPYASTVLRRSPEAYWRLDETDPYDLAVDASGHGHTFEYHDTPGRTGAGDDVGPRPAEFNGFEADNNSPRLTGGPLGVGRTDDGYVGIVDGVLPGAPGALNNDYSVEMWFRRGADPNPHGDYLMHRNDLGAPVNTGDFLGVSDYSGDDFHLYVYSGDGDVPNRHGTTLLQKDQWYHVGMVRQGDDVEVYLNGQLEIATTMPSEPGASWADGTWAFGGRTDLPKQQKYAGNIDEIALYGGVRGKYDFQESYLTALSRPDPSHYSDIVLADGPEAYWRLNETDEWIVAMDATGNGHNFEYHDETSRSGVAPDVGPRPPEFNGLDWDNNAPRLEGTPKEGYIGIAEDVLPGQADYTAEMWFRRDGDQGPHGSIYLMHRNDLDAGVMSGDYLGLIPNPGNSAETILFAYNGSDPDIVWGMTDLLVDEWYHVAMLREGNEISLYLNGELESQGIMPLRAGTKWDDGVWTFGNRSDMFDNDQRFNGNLDEIALYGRLLGAGEIRAHFLAAVVPEPATAVVWLLLAVAGIGCGRFRRRTR